MISCLWGQLKKKDFVHIGVYSQRKEIAPTKAISFFSELSLLTELRMVELLPLTVYPLILMQVINRIYDGVKASPRKSQARFQII